MIKKMSHTAQGMEISNFRYGNSFFFCAVIIILKNHVITFIQNQGFFRFFWNEVKTSLEWHYGGALLPQTGWCTAAPDWTQLRFQDQWGMALALDPTHLWIWIVISRQMRAEDMQPGKICCQPANLHIHARAISQRLYWVDGPIRGDTREKGGAAGAPLREF